MPKQPTKKSHKKPTKTAKPTPTKAKKAPAKKTAAAHEPKRGFMWKLLERKQAELKRLVGAGPKHPFTHTDPKAATHPHGPNGHARFNGPRRKAA